MKRDYEDLGWKTGRIYGVFGTCGWVRSGRVDPPDGSTVPTGCAGDFRPSAGTFADTLNCRETSKPTVPAVKECRKTTPIGLKTEKRVRNVDFCLNVEPTPVNGVPTRCESKIEDRLTYDNIRAGYQVGWRYTTNGNRFVLVNDPNVANDRRGVWGFIPRRAFRSQLCTRKSNLRLNCGSANDPDSAPGGG